jgi:hydroxymethylpyrimidine/phosphomethylpyrimidine kinase
MRTPRPYVLSIAGHDPSGGAGLLADIKTFEAHKVYGLGVISGNTFQTDKEFLKTDWVPVEKILEQVDLLYKRFGFEYIKIGLIQSLEVLMRIVEHCLKLAASCRIIWDPVLKASAGFEFHKEIDANLLKKILSKIFLLTPNADEADQLAGGKGAKELSKYCHVLLKGGHREDKPGYDTLYTKEGKEFSFRPREKTIFPKHGSGCILSSAITANLAKGEALQRACLLGKEYTERTLNSNHSLLAYHKL